MSEWSTGGLPPSLKEAAAALPAEAAATPSGLAAWLLDREGGQRLEEGRRYFGFMKLMRETFHAIAEVYDHWSPPDSDGTKQHLRFIGPDEMLVLAHQLYQLSAEGVGGCVLECGCAHGYSSCCLRHACAHLGRSLVIADSFQGLPGTRPDEEFFRAGDYAARRSEVEAHIRWLGRPEAVRYVEGWYRDSLANWREPVALLWMDVDLYESARDVMAGVFPSVDRRGIIASHEFTDFHGKPHPRGALTVTEAIFQRFEAEGLPFQQAVIMRYFGLVSFAGGPPPAAAALALAVNDRLARLDERARAYEDLRDSRTVRWAFRLKRMLGGFRR